MMNIEKGSIRNMSASARLSRFLSMAETFSPLMIRFAILYPIFAFNQNNLPDFQV